jgi:hypothetical protein
VPLQIANSIMVLAVILSKFLLARELREYPEQRWEVCLTEESAYMIAL